MASIYSFMRYADARAAIEWLCNAFGFEKHAVVEGEDGRIAHAELTPGADAIVMLGSIQNDTLGLRVPREIGAVTGGIYAAVDDLGAHYRRAQEAGAEVVQELTDDGFGGRYSARDLEGHLWGFGDYRPVFGDREASELNPPGRCSSASHQESARTRREPQKGRPPSGVADPYPVEPDDELALSPAPAHVE